ncbi:MAG: hypothetical protein QOF76_2091 [Solirubrobacteraceae bacterium]|nr:hypothetical protein [Solirubrobacteraceae bacterium]
MIRRATVLAVLLIAAPAHAAAPDTCGAPHPTKVITGTFTTDQTGSFVELPFSVPRGTTAVRAWYCYDQPEINTTLRHTLDFGFYGPRPHGRTLWSMRQYRGWSGSGFFKDITVSPRGFATDPDPSKKPAVNTSRGYRPGPITPGRWAAELGVAAVVGPDQGDTDGALSWRVELQLETAPRFARHPYRPARYRTRPAAAGPAWYAGDMHVHSEQSGDAKQDAPAAAIFDYAFGAAALDFVQVTDHNTDAGWGEWGRYQAAHPGKLIARNEEITTYRGHINAPGVRRIADYRTGPVFRRNPDGSLTQLRAARPASAIFDAVHRAGGVTTINHPTIFDARIPAFSSICRGCSWEYDDAETDYAKVDAVEVETGPQGLKIQGSPGPNPFTPLALEFYEHAMEAGGHIIAAVSGSDSHAGGTSDPTDITGTPIGSPATMVYARRLSERGIAAAVRAGHTYVRSFGKASPTVELTSGGQMMGDTVRAAAATFDIRVRGGSGDLLVVTRNGTPVDTTLLTSDDAAHAYSATAPATGTDRYGILVTRGTAIEAVTTPMGLTSDA